MAAILHHRFLDKVVRLDILGARRRGLADGTLVRVWGFGPDGVLACRWTAAPMVRRSPTGGPAA